MRVRVFTPFRGKTAGPHTAPTPYTGHPAVGLQIGAPAPSSNHAVGLHIGALPSHSVVACIPPPQRGKRAPYNGSPYRGPSLYSNSLPSLPLSLNRSQIKFSAEVTTLTLAC